MTFLEWLDKSPYSTSPSDFQTALRDAYAVGYTQRAATAPTLTKKLEDAEFLLRELVNARSGFGWVIGDVESVAARAEQMLGRRGTR